MTIRSAVIIGSGNVATHLGNALKQSGVAIEAVFSRNLEHASLLGKQLAAKAYNQLSELPSNADLYIIAVNDSAIESVSNQLIVDTGLVVHTSGNTALSVLHKHKRIGVFYPLQTFSKNTTVNFLQIPILIESTQQQDTNLLQSLAIQCGTKAVEANSEKRAVVHLAAVFANNFTNHLFAVANDILTSNGLSFDLLKPLITETANKVQHNQPHLVQTGPAVRNDMATIEKHVQLLKSFPQYQQLYELISQNIKETQQQNNTH